MALLENKIVLKRNLVGCLLMLGITAALTLPMGYMHLFLVIFVNPSPHQIYLVPIPAVLAGFVALSIFKKRIILSWALAGVCLASITGIFLAYEIFSSV